MPIKKKRHKRGSRYRTGLHVSPKLLNSPAKYRSGWELEYMKWLDKNDQVINYKYESVVIAYLGNVKTGKLKKYIPDLLVHYQDGSNELLEIKPKKKLVNKVVCKKEAAALIWCREHDATYRFITEDDLKKLGLLK